jgi:mannitol/fructose-specific phosphotransferase system IIA component (Ntr-type)
MIIFAGAKGYLDRYPVSKLAAYERHLTEFLDKKYSGFMDVLKASGEFTAEIEAGAAAVLDDFAKLFDPDMSLDSMDAGLSRGFTMAIGNTTSLSRSELLRIIERATARELVTPSIEDDLDKMLKIRETQAETVKDRFDAVLEKCSIIDIKENISLEELFSRAAEILSPYVNCEADVITKKFIAREKSGSTALTQTFAIPHIICPGEKKFCIVVFRCMPGISFGPDKSDVRAIFFLAGSIDERDFHLLALAAIAQIVDSPTFVQRWTSAAGPDDLRGVMLLAKRKKTV